MKGVHWLAFGVGLAVGYLVLPMVLGPLFANIRRAPVAG